MARFILRSLAVLSCIVFAAAAATRPRYGGELRMEIAGRVTASEPANWPPPVASLIFDSLVALDESGRVQPSLAVSWEHDRERKRWQFRLRPGVRFHDGTPVTAASLAAGLKLPYTVTAAGDSIVFQSGTPAPRLPQELARRRNAVFHQSADGSLAGTGPFRIADWQAGRQVTLVANEDYWAGRPFLDSIVIQMGRPPREQAIDLELGKSDVVEIAPPDARRAAQRGLRLWSSRPLELLALVFESGRPAVADARLREAVAATVDRAAIHDVLLQRQGEAAASLLPQWLSGYAFLFSTAANLERARSLAATLPQPGARCTLAYDPGDAAARSIAERIAVNAREAGITLQLTARGDADIRLMRLRFDSTDPAQALSDAAAALGMADLVDPTPDASPEKLLQAERRLLDSYRVTPIAHLREVFGLAPRIHFWPEPGRAELRLEDVWLEPATP